MFGAWVFDHGLGVSVLFLVLVVDFSVLRGLDETCEVYETGDWVHVWKRWTFVFVCFGEDGG